jgi:prepilin-type N-terminal cleavage/methylation domain-containing protein
MTSRPTQCPVTRRQRGFGLLEIIIGVAIVAVLSVAIFGRANKAQYAANVSQTLDDLALISTQLKAGFQAISPGNYAALGNQTGQPTGITSAFRSNALPDDLSLTQDNNAPPNVTAVANRFGGTLDILAGSVSGGNNNAIRFRLTGVPAQVCGQLLQNAASAFNTIQLTGDAAGAAAVNIRTNGGPVPGKPAIDTACAAVTTAFTIDLFAV